MAPLAFADDYPGYNPKVHEAPNGDGKWDEEKKYSHVYPSLEPGHVLLNYYARAWSEACRVHVKLNLPWRLAPSYSASCLRILEYAPGVGGEAHTDFDWFTIQLYRSHPDRFRCMTYSDGSDVALSNADHVSSGIHFGEMAELAGVRKATMHGVFPHPTETQKSIVFFAIPNPNEALVTVESFLAERKARSRR
jgi:hypothetical protein